MIDASADNQEIANQQIEGGVDIKNVALRPLNIDYKLTDSEGNVILQFDDLKDGKTYKVFVTASNIMPY